MSFASGGLLAHVAIEDTDPVVLYTAQVDTEISQIVVSSKRATGHPVATPVSIYHAEGDTPEATDDNVLYKNIFVRHAWTLTSPAAGSGIMLEKGQSLMAVADTQISIAVYGVTANIAPGGIYGGNQ